MTIDAILIGIIAARTFPQIDHTTRIYIVTGTDRVDIPLTCLLSAENANTATVSFPKETVTLQKWSNGQKRFWIGYGPQTNTLLVRGEIE